MYLIPLLYKRCISIKYLLNTLIRISRTEKIISTKLYKGSNSWLMNPPPPPPPSRVVYRSQTINRIELCQPHFAGPRKSLLNLYAHTIFTPGRRQSKTLFAIDERGSKIVRNSVFDWHLSPIERQMAFENSVSNDFWSTFVDGINVCDCRLPGVILLMWWITKS